MQCYEPVQLSNAATNRSAQSESTWHTLPVNIQMLGPGSLIPSSKCFSNWQHPQPLTIISAKKVNMVLLGL
jgi:hypothetical protein